MNLRALLGHLDVIASGGPDVDVTNVTRDSRDVRPGCVFVAIRGARVDGHAFVTSLPPGTVAVVDHPVSVPQGVAFVEVPDPRVALARLAALLHGRPADRLQVVGVTGTNGKTSVVTLLQQVLEATGVGVARIGTTGVRLMGQERPGSLTTPEAPDLHGWFAELEAAGGRAVAMEVSSIGLDQHRVDAIPFTLGIFTMLGRDHLDYHGTFEAYVAAKARLFTDLLRPAGGMPRALMCADDPHWRDLQPPEDRWLFGMSPEADVAVLDWEARPEGTWMSVRAPFGRIEVVTPLIGRYNVLNVVAALSAAVILGRPVDAVVAALAQAPGPPGRLERVPNDRGLTVLVDYAHTPDALQAAIASVRAVTPGRVWVVFGCGGDRDRGKRPEMGRAALSADHVVVTSDNPRTEDPEAILDDILVGIPEGRAWVEVDRDVAIRRAVRAAAPGDAVLIAGKGHETTQEVAGRKLAFDDRKVARAALEER